MTEFVDPSTEILEFGRIFLIVAAGVVVAVLLNKATTRIPVPVPGILLLAAALASDLFPTLGAQLTIQNVERIAVVALVLILFDGGMHVGWRRFRRSVVPITVLGVAGTFATAALMAVAAHYVLDLGWTPAGILGAAIAPTDPAVMFSVLGPKEVGGRTGTILEGESGANDPVGIALMVGLLELATSDGGSFSIVVIEFLREMGVGLAVGLAGGALLVPFIRRVSLPSEGLYPLRTLASAGVVYGAASVAHGSGFLAVFVAGIIVGDVAAPYKGEIEHFHKGLASLAEVVVFAALGVTIDLSSLGGDRLWLDALVVAAILAFAIRPAVVGALLLPVRLRWGERLFVMWGGLKGAVPILLAAFALLADVSDRQTIYDIVFVVVAFSVVVQGASIPYVARRLGVPMRTVEPEPWDVSVRLAHEPRGVQRFVVAPGTAAAGSAIRDLPMSEGNWVSLVVKDGRAESPRGSYVLEPGDEVLVLTESEDEDALRHLFEGRTRDGGGSRR
jgi:cell volume regulation protein A